MSAFRDVAKKAREGYRVGMQRWGVFMERQGFYVMLGVCVAIIVGAAIWTRSSTPPVVPPENLQADQQAGSEAEFVQRLSDVTWTGTAPDGTQQDASVGAGQAGTSPDSGAASRGTPDNPVLTLPVQGEVLRGYSNAEPVLLPTLGVWATHDGIDIQADVGDPVNAAMSGTVAAAYEDPMLGKVIELQHPGGFLTRYAGLATLDLLKVGDPVKTGQLLSPLGELLPQESEDPPHLHFEVLRDDEWVDPRTFLMPK